MEHCNDMIISWIQYSVSLEHRSSTAHANTTASIWNDLREKFSIQKAPCIFQLSKSVSQSTQDTVSQYYNKLKVLWDDLEIYELMPTCTYGLVKTLMEYAHHSRVMQFLMGLNGSYDAVCAQILLHESLPPLNRVLSLVLHHEERRHKLLFMPSPIAMVAKAPDHRVTPTARKDRLYCSHSNILGHSVE